MNPPARTPATTQRSMTNLTKDNTFRSQDILENKEFHLQVSKAPGKPEGGWRRTGRVPVSLTVPCENTG